MKTRSTKKGGKEVIEAKSGNNQFGLVWAKKNKSNHITRLKYNHMHTQGAHRHIRKQLHTQDH